MQGFANLILDNYGQDRGHPGHSEPTQPHMQQAVF